MKCLLRLNKFNQKLYSDESSNQFNMLELKTEISVTIWQSDPLLRYLIKIRFLNLLKINWKKIIFDTEVHTWQVSRTFPAFKSRCIMPCLCKCTKPWHIPRQTYAICFSVRPFSRSTMMVSSAPPSQNSMKICNEKRTQTLN